MATKYLMSSPRIAYLFGAGNERCCLRPRGRRGIRNRSAPGRLTDATDIFTTAFVRGGDSADERKSLGNRRSRLSLRDTRSSSFEWLATRDAPVSRDQFHGTILQRRDSNPHLPCEVSEIFTTSGSDQLLLGAFDAEAFRYFRPRPRAYARALLSPPLRSSSRTRSKSCNQLSRRCEQKRAA